MPVIFGELNRKIEAVVGRTIIHQYYFVIITRQFLRDRTGSLVKFMDVWCRLIKGRYDG